jgi:hypothetical protein
MFMLFYEKNWRWLMTIASIVAVEYTIKKAQENQVGLKLNGTSQFLVCADINKCHKER